MGEVIPFRRNLPQRRTPASELNPFSVALFVLAAFMIGALQLWAGKNH